MGVSLTLFRSRPAVIVTFFVLVTGAVFFVGTLNKSSADDEEEVHPIVTATPAKLLAPGPAEEFPELMSDRSAERFFGALRSLFNLDSDEPPALQERRELFAMLFDTGVAFAERRKAAWRLSRFADDEICAGLKRFLTDPAQDSALKALIAEGLGESTASQAEELILHLLENGNEIEVCGAIRGLAARGTDKETDRLEQMLSAPELEEYVQDEIISALGRIQTPKACSVLMDLYVRAADDIPFQTALIESLSQKEISQTADFFDRVLADPATDPEIRRAVAEAIGTAEGGTAPALVRLLSDSDADVRMEAAWGLVAMDQPPEIVSQIFRSLDTEADPLIRKYLYDALALQEPAGDRLPAETVSRVFTEESTAAKVSGFLLLASRIREPGNDLLRQQFDGLAVPELTRIALLGKNTSERIQAVKVLDRAGTETSREALLAVVSGSGDSRVINAAGVDLEKLMGGM